MGIRTTMRRGLGAALTIVALASGAVALSAAPAQAMIKTCSLGGGGDYGVQSVTVKIDMNTCGGRVRGWVYCVGYPTKGGQTKVYKWGPVIEGTGASKATCDITDGIQGAGYDYWANGKWNSSAGFGNGGYNYASYTIDAGTAGVCYSAHVQNIGWQTQVCNGVVAGTVGQNLNLEALNLSSSDGMCAQAHVSNIGWQPMVCNGNPSVGTTGRNLPIEAVRLTFPDSHCAQAHVANLGWLSTVCGTDITIGTTGRALAMQALRIW